MRTPHDIDVLILGAGPAGLSLGRELSVRGIPYLILEKEEVVGSTFANMTESTTYGPWMNNTLPGSPVPWTQKLRRTTRPEYAQYLKDYAHRHQLRVSCGVKVQATYPDRQGFLVQTEDENLYRCDYLVNATGYFSKPNYPELPGLRVTSIPYVHSAGYRSPQTIEELTGKGSSRVLIVGSRLSAGEILQELHQAGHQVHLSHRGPIDTWPSPLQETLLSPLTYLWEELSLRMRWKRPGNLRPRLRKGQQWELLTSGRVPCHPDLLRLESDRVVFVDRSQGQFDAIVFATGYKPALDHLAPLIKQVPPWVSGLESVDVPNLFFMGLSGSRSFRSEFLRGIREDAPYLAQLLQERMAPPVLRALPSAQSSPAALPAGRRPQADISRLYPIAADRGDQDPGR